MTNYGEIFESRLFIDHINKVNKSGKQAGAELCQAQLPNGILLSCD